MLFPHKLFHIFCELAFLPLSKATELLLSVVHTASLYIACSFVNFLGPACLFITDLAVTGGNIITQMQSCVQGLDRLGSGFPSVTS